ncbi:MAG: porin [Candidatus Accumulibacter sp.]|jgi:predicted porin|nr:porin [Accumulibacter sp.]
MQKKVIALAVAGLVSGAAFAQTNVTVYGVADATVEMVQAKDATNDNDIKNHTRINTNSSILGFRGSEDLGGGLKAVFQFETNVQLDSDTSSRNTVIGSRRDTFVGLQGGFGQVKAGTLTGPARSLGAAVDLVAGATGIGSAIPMFGKLGGYAGGATAPAGGMAPATSGFSTWDTRRSNAIQYVTPKFGGFEVRAQYSAGENPAYSTVNDNKPGQTYELGAFYINGPWFAGVTYGQEKPRVKTTAAAPVSGTAYSIKRTNVRFAGSYTFQGGHKIAALFEQNKEQEDTYSDLKSYTYGIGAKFKVSQPGAIIAQVYQTGKLDGMATDKDKYKANFISLGYEHSLSKRTILKAYYSRIANKDYANYNYGIGNIANASVGSNPTGLAVGIRHTF